MRLFSRGRPTSSEIGAAENSGAEIGGGASDGARPTQAPAAAPGHVPGEDAAARPLRIVAADVAELRQLVLRHQGERIRSLIIEVSRWNAPFEDWRGQPRALPGLLRQVIEFGDEPAVRIELTYAEPTAASSAISAMIPLLVPAAGLSAWASCLIAIDGDTPESGLASLPLDARPFEPEPDPLLLRGADLLVTGPGSEPDERANSFGVVTSGGALIAAGSVQVGDPHLPVIDPRVHRPIGRLRAQAKGIQAALAREDGGWQIRHRSGETLARLGSAPLTPGEVARLARVTRLNLATLEMPGEGDPLTPAETSSLASRLAEVAAVGVELHSAPPHARVFQGWPRELAGLVTASPSTTTGIERTARSLRQRRLALQRFAGPLRLASAGRADQIWPELPAVTALLVSRRPGELTRVLAQLAAQTYPHLEIVIGLHGVAISERRRAELLSSPGVSAVYEAPADEVFGHVLGRVSAMAQGDLLTKVDDDDIYGPDHVWDLVLARLYSGAHIVGKRAQYAYLAERDVTVHRKTPAERYTRVVAGGTILIGAADLTAVGGWRPVPRSVDRGLIERVRGEGGIVYATEGIGYVYVRHSQGHTWQVELDQLAANALETWQGVPAEVAGTRTPSDSVEHD
ncbi:hypothetical protein [Rarobacter faecitabidus]|uniref:Glycosyl transferase family 2 n=1 Tax=Rarobacter faecitabidus TaxID=13243 RepID=A0A542ZU60_RARFA|nr:hypothetical protein [Rarobacter faecitabidus]TQL63895.1 hypothetical protein FB461_0374 [Rarobacter faecitabidus]